MRNIFLLIIKLEKSNYIIILLIPIMLITV